MSEADSCVRCPLCQTSVPKNLYKAHIVNSCHQADDTNSSPPKVARRDLTASRARSDRLKAILRLQTVQDKLLKTSRDEALFLKLRLFRQRSPAENSSSPKPLLLTVRPFVKDNGSEEEALLESLEIARADYRMARGVYRQGSLLSARLLAGRDMGGQKLSASAVRALLLANRDSLRRLELASCDAAQEARGRGRRPAPTPQLQLPRLRTAKLHRASVEELSMLGSSLRSLSLSEFAEVPARYEDKLTGLLSGFSALRSLALSNPPTSLWTPLRSSKALARLKSLRISGLFWPSTHPKPTMVPELRRLKICKPLTTACGFTQITSLAYDHFVPPSGTEEQLSQAFQPLPGMSNLAHLSILFRTKQYQSSVTRRVEGMTSGWLSRWTELGQLDLVSLALEVPPEPLRLHVSPRRLRCLRVRAKGIGRPSLPPTPSLPSCQQLLARLTSQIQAELLGGMEYPLMQELELQGLSHGVVKGLSPSKFPALEVLHWNGALYSASVDGHPLATCHRDGRDPRVSLIAPLRAYVAEAEFADAVVAKARASLAESRKAVEEAVRRREQLDRDHQARLNEAAARLEEN